MYVEANPGFGVAGSKPLLNRVFPIVHVNGWLPGRHGGIARIPGNGHVVFLQKHQILHRPKLLPAQGGGNDQE